MFCRDSVSASQLTTDVIGTALLVFIVGCASRGYTTSGFAEPRDSYAEEASPTMPMRNASPVASAGLELKVAAEPESVDLANDVQASPGKQRIVIYTATLRMVVVEIDASIKQTETIAVEFKGWVQSISGDSITIRVPADQYEAAVAKIEALGRVSDRQLQASDVTEEYVDLEARLKNALAVRDRLNALLAKAEDVKAALEVEKELARVGEEIERLQGKMELLKNRVAFSTITINFERVYRSTQPPQVTRVPFEWLNELNPNRLLMVR